MPRQGVDLLFLGHVDAGKSTLAGRLLCDCGSVDRRTRAKLQEQAEVLGRPPAWVYTTVLQRLAKQHEGVHGYSADALSWQLQTRRLSLRLRDAPGTRDFFRSMFSQLPAADQVALFVVSPSRGEFEASVGRCGQLRELAVVAHAVGVRSAVVAVTKMDTVAYSEARYQEVTTEVSRLLAKSGFDVAERVTFVPVSALCGANIVRAPAADCMPWYEGPTLVRAVDDVPLKAAVASSFPLRMPIKDVFRVKGVGTVVVGTVLCGVLRPGMRVTLAPKGLVATVGAAQRNFEELTEVSADTAVGVHLVDVPVRECQRGMVLCDAAAPAARATLVDVRMEVLHCPSYYVRGFTPVVAFHTKRVACRFVDISSVSYRWSGRAVQREEDGRVRAGESCDVVLEPMKPLCVETAADVPAMGRVAVYDMRRMIAVGQVRSVWYGPLGDGGTHPPVSWMRACRRRSVLLHVLASLQPEVAGRPLQEDGAGPPGGERHRVAALRWLLSARRIGRMRGAAGSDAVGALELVEPFGRDVVRFV